MEQLFNFILIFHSVAGGISLLSGSVNMIRRKTGAVHRKMGLVYFYSVLLNAITAFALSIFHPNLFLISLGVMSAYFVISGRRNLLKAKPMANKMYQPIDWILTISLFCFGLLLSSHCLYQSLLSDLKTIPLIPLIFGLFSLLLSMRVISKIRSSNELSDSFFLKAHIVNIVGSYITMFSAFIVVNNHGYFPVWIGWFGPAIFLLPLMFFWIKKYTSSR